MYSYSKIIKKLLKKNISVSTVESCTGGLLSSKFTSFAGISKIYNMGLITYSNQSKIKLLKINKKILNKHGAVSYQIALLMVKNLKKISHSKLCISTTGIAGPSGGSKKKPVGLIYIGIYYNNNIKIFEKKYAGSRKQIQNKTILQPSECNFL